MALKEIKYIQFDDEKGVLYSAGKQSLLIPVDFIIHLNNILAELAGKPATKILLYKIGEALGEGYAETLKKILKNEKIKISRETLLKEVYNAISMEAGWGIIKIKKLNLKTGEIEINIKNSPSNQLAKNNNFDLERGIFSGAYKEIFEKEIYYEAVKDKNEEEAAIITSLKETPEDIIKKEKMILIERKELEKKIEERTEELENTKKSLLNILEDIDEARHKIDEEKNKTLSIIINLSDGLLVFDKEIFEKDNKLVLINPEAENILGIKNKESIGKSFKELASYSSAKLLIDLIEKEPKKIIRRELKIRENLIMEVSVIHLIMNGKKTGSLIILHDVSREKEIETIKSEFVSTAAHQLRTPLSAIKWSLQMIINGDLGYISPEQKTFLMQGYQSNERMINLVNDLLNVARIEEGRFGYNFSLIHFEDLIDNVIQDFSHQIEKKQINFKYLKPTRPLSEVKVDPSKIRLVLGNLIDNAIKYTPEKGQVTISIKYVNMGIEVYVKDSGIGIPREQQKKMFSKFFRSDNAVKAQTEGSGLGLFIVKNIIEKHGGKIWFESTEDKGSTFYFTLPTAK